MRLGPSQAFAAFAPVAILWLCAALWRPIPPHPMGATRSLVDERGRVVPIATPLGLQAVFMGIGLGPYLMVARDPAALVTSRTSENERIATSPYLRAVFPDMARLRMPLSGVEAGTFNIETLLRERPSVVVTWARLAGGFERVGLPTIGILPVSSTARLEQNTALYASIADDAPRGAAIIARSQALRREVAAEVAEKATARPRIMFLLPLAAGRWRVAAVFADIVAAADGIDVAAGLPRFAMLDAERIVALAPDVIVVIGGPAAGVVTPARLMADPTLASVPAVRARRVYAAPPGVSGHMMTTMELPIQARWLADILHPGELAPEAPALAARVYATELGVTPSPAEIDRDLAGAANAGSLGGGR